MKGTFFLLPVLAAAAFAAAAVAALPPVSPEDMAAETERWIVEGGGARFPEGMAGPVREGDGLVFVDGTWPAPFRDRIGETVLLRISETTGCYEFSDPDGAVFWTVVPVAPLTWDWVTPFRLPPGGPSGELYSPFRLSREWSLRSPEGRAGTSSLSKNSTVRNSEFADNSGQLRFANVPTNLCFSAFFPTNGNFFFTADWPASEPPRDGFLDLYGTSNILSPSWTFLSSHPATNPPVSFSVAETSLPWYVPSIPHVHDATCSAATNLVLSPLDGTTVYTNLFWSCSTNRATGEAGFFRLGTRDDTDGDELTDAFELLVSGTNPDRLDTDCDGIPDGVSTAEWYANPLWATNGADADFIVDIVMPQNANEETVLRLDGLAVPLSPNAGPWAFSLPPGEIVPCSATSTAPFFILWAGNAGGSFWDSPDSFEKPIWTRGMSSVSGYHTAGGSCDVAVPVLTAEPVLDGTPLPGGAPGCSHVSSDGSVCVHGGSGIQRFSLSVAPAALATGRTPVATGAVQIDATGPFVDVSGTTGEREGTIGFAPGTASGAGGVLWGSIETGISAHRCDATAAFPYCSVCGCHRSEACGVVFSGACATRTNSTVRIPLQADSPRDWSIAGPAGFQMRLFTGETGGTPALSVENAASVWVGGGTGPEECVVTAKCPGEQCAGTDLPVWTLYPVFETVTGARDGRSFVVNPAGTVCGETETFRLSVLPASYVSRKNACWQADAGATVLDSGTEARIRFDTDGGKDVWFSMPGYVCAEPKTRCLVYPYKKRVALHRFYILDAEGQLPASQVDTPSGLTEVNRIWRQAGIEFYWASANPLSGYTNFSSIRRDTQGLADFAIQQAIMGKTGLRVFFPQHVSDSNGNPGMFSLLSPNSADAGWSFGIFLDPSCTPRVFAHELGHACGLDDIYTSLPNATEEAPEFRRGVLPGDFSEDGTGEEFYFPAGATRGSIVSRLLMHGHGAVGAGQVDLPRGPVLGFDEGGVEGAILCGILDTCRNPKSFSLDNQ